MVELSKALVQHRYQNLGFFVAGACWATVAQQRLFNGGHIGQCQFGINDFDVPDRIDAARNVNHIVVCKATDDMQDSIRLADIGKKLVTQALAF